MQSPGRFNGSDEAARSPKTARSSNELCSLRFVDAPNDDVILGPVRLGKTLLASALGHIAARRARSVHFEAPTSSSDG
jgi:DNA replication protein DnaC